MFNVSDKMLIVLAALAPYPLVAYAGAPMPSRQGYNPPSQSSPVLTPPPLQGPPPEFTCPPSVIGFAPGSATLSKEAAAYLRSNIPRIKEGCAGSVVVGFADPSDNSADLERLARHRARVVADLLIQGGLNPSFVSVQTRVYSPSTYGPETADQAAQNRIAEVRDNN